MTDAELLERRGQVLSMTARQALTLAEMALDHVAHCTDDEDGSFECARRIVAAMLRRRRCGVE
jgi:hypothetical protein